MVIIFAAIGRSWARGGPGSQPGALRRFVALTLETTPFYHGLLRAGAGARARANGRLRRYEFLPIRRATWCGHRGQFSGESHPTRHRSSYTLLMGHASRQSRRTEPLGADIASRDELGYGQIENAKLGERDPRHTTHHPSGSARNTVSEMPICFLHYGNRPVIHCPRPGLTRSPGNAPFRTVFRLPARQNRGRVGQWWAAPGAAVTWTADGAGGTRHRRVQGGGVPRSARLS